MFHTIGFNEKNFFSKSTLINQGSELSESTGGDTTVIRYRKDKIFFEPVFTIQCKIYDLKFNFGLVRNLIPKLFIRTVKSFENTLRSPEVITFSEERRYIIVGGAGIPSPDFVKI